MIATSTKPNLNSGIVLVSIIWIVAILSASLVAVMQGGVTTSLWPYSLCAIAPALLALALYPVMEKEWAQIAIIFAWIGLAILATLAIAFVPMAFLFLCAPAAAALFAREKVIEAMVLSALAAGFVYYANRFGFGASLAIPEQFSQWGRATAPAATIVFMIGAMYAAASYRDAREQALVYTDETQTDHDILDVYPGAAFQLDENANILRASRTAFNVLGLDQDEALDKPLTELVLSHANDIGADVDDSVLAVAIDDVSVSGVAQHFTLHTNLVDRVDNHKRVLDVTLSPDNQGNIYAFLRDVSPLSRRLNALDAEQGKSEQGDADKPVDDKSLFFAGVSHELRTPLNAIIGFSDMMKSRLFGPLPGKYAEYAQLINESGQHMLDLIGDVLDVSKIGAGKYDLAYDDFDAADVVRSSVKMIRPTADAAQIQLSTEISGDSPIMLRADRRAVRQVLLNLLSNAVKFSPKGSRVTISTMNIGDNVNFIVEDQGAGMSEDELSRVGEPYAQGASAAMSEARGSGLGLSLVKSLTELHGGQFAISSTPGNGTTVSIDLPSRGGDQS